MIKVLMVGNSPYVKGGITSVISQIRGHKWESDGILLQFIPTYIDYCNVVKLFYFIISCIRIVFIFIVNKPQILYMHMSYKGSFYRKYFLHSLCKIWRIKAILHIHGSEFKDWYENCDKKIKLKVNKLLKDCKAVIVLGDEWKHRILEIEKETNTIILNNTVSVPDIKVEWNEKRCQVIFLGVLIKRKGVSDLIDAIEILKKQNKLSNIHFVIAGDGEEMEQLQKRVENLKLSDVVSFVGWVENSTKEDLIKNSQVMVLPSYNEGLPISVLEALSYGMPVIATDVGDMSVAVKDGYNGFLITPGDVDALSDSLFKINTRETFEKFSVNSKKMAEDVFSDNEYFRRLAKCFKE